MAIDIETASQELWKSQSTKNWSKFASVLKKSDAKYYKVVFPNEKLKNKSDLKASKILLFDSDQKQTIELPLFVNSGKKIRGATIYLEGLRNINK